MNIHTYLPNVTDTLSELIDTGNDIWNLNREGFDRALTTAQNRIDEIGNSLILGAVALFLTSAFIIIAGVVGSFAIAEILTVSLAPMLQVNSLLLVSLFWISLAILAGWFSFRIISTTGKRLQQITRFKHCRRKQWWSR